MGMNRGYINVSATASAYFPQQLVGRSYSDASARVEFIKSADARLVDAKVTLYAPGGSSAESALMVANKYLDRAAVVTESYFGSARLSSDLTTVGTTPLAPKTVTDREFDAFLRRDHGPAERFYGLLRLSFEDSDVISSFLISYMVLLSTQRDKFEEVDAFIRSREPDVEMRPGRHRRGKHQPSPDTVYTALRHDIAHARDSDIQSIRRSMREHLPTLRAHAIAAVNAYTPQ